MPPSPATAPPPWIPAVWRTPLRRWLPRTTRLAGLSEAAFTQAIQLYNNTPRKCLGYRTPAETFDDGTWNVNSPSRFRGNDGGWVRA